MGIGQNFKRQMDFVLIDFLHIKFHLSRSKVAQDHPLSGSRARGQGGRVATRAPLRRNAGCCLNLFSFIIIHAGDDAGKKMRQSKTDTKKAKDDIRKDG